MHSLFKNIYKGAFCAEMGTMDLCFHSSLTYDYYCPVVQRYDLFSGTSLAFDLAFEGVLHFLLG